VCVLCENRYIGFIKQFVVVRRNLQRFTFTSIEYDGCVSLCVSVCTRCLLKYFFVVTGCSMITGGQQHI
jgi:hypothetical protein